MERTSSLCISIIFNFAKIDVDQFWYRVSLCQSFAQIRYKALQTTHVTYWRAYQHKKKKMNRAGNSDELRTQNCPPQNCPSKGISRSGYSEGGLPTWCLMKGCLVVKEHFINQYPMLYPIYSFVENYFWIDVLLTRSPSSWYYL